MTNDELIAEFGITEGAPQRACVLTLRVSGDTARDVAEALRQLAFEVDRGRLTKGLSAGYSSSYNYVFRQADAPTHDEYISALNAWLEARNVMRKLIFMV